MYQCQRSHTWGANSWPGGVCLECCDTQAADSLYQTPRCARSDSNGAEQRTDSRTFSLCCLNADPGILRGRNPFGFTSTRVAPAELRMLRFARIVRRQVSHCDCFALLYNVLRSSVDK